MQNFVAKIIQDPEDENELAIQFPDDFMEEFDWREGDVIEWQILKDGQVMAINKTLEDRKTQPEM